MPLYINYGRSKCVQQECSSLTPFSSVQCRIYEKRGSGHIIPLLITLVYAPGGWTHGRYATHLIHDAKSDVAALSAHIHRLLLAAEQVGVLDHMGEENEDDVDAQDDEGGDHEPEREPEVDPTGVEVMRWCAVGLVQHFESDLSDVDDEVEYNGYRSAQN